MNKKKSEHKRIYKKGLMTLEERNNVDKERRTELMYKKMKGNKKIKPDIFGNPVW